MVPCRESGLIATNPDIIFLNQFRFNEVPDDEAGGSIRREQIWDVVSYVLSLPYEPLSQGPPQRQGSKYTPR